MPEFCRADCVYFPPGADPSTDKGLPVQLKVSITMSPHGSSTFTSTLYEDHRLVLVMIRLIGDDATVWVRDSTSVTLKKMGVKIGGTHDIGRVDSPDMLCHRLDEMATFYHQNGLAQLADDVEIWFGRSKTCLIEYQSSKLLKPVLEAAGWTWHRPSHEHGPVDVLLSKDGRTLRVQLKTASGHSSSKHSRCWICKGTGNKQPYEKGDFDLLIVSKVERGILLGYWIVTLDELYTRGILPEMKMLKLFSKVASKQARSKSYRPSLKWWVRV